MATRSVRWAFRWLLPACVVAGLAGTPRAERLPITSFTIDDGLASDGVGRIVLDSRGFLWSCHPSGLSRFDGQRFRAYGPEQGLPEGSTRDLLETRDGRYLVATAEGLYRLEPLARERLFVPFETPDGPPPSILSLAQDAAGRIWAGTVSGLYRVSLEAGTARFHEIELPAGGAPNRWPPYIFDLLAARDGSLWIASTSGLVHRSASGQLRRYGVAEGLPGDDLRCLLEDGEGRIWAGGTSGLVRLAAEPDAVGRIVSETYRRGRGLPSDFVYALHQTGDGTLWVGSDGLVSITRTESGERRLRSWSTLNGLTQNSVSGLAEDGCGNLWIGTESAGLMRWTRGGLVSFGEPEGIDNPRISSIVETRAGELCVTTASGFFCRTDGRFRQVRVPLPARLSWGWYQIVLQDHLGQWWFATSEGLARFPAVARVEDLSRTKPVSVYRARDGLPADYVFRVYEDSRGDIWIGTISEPPRVQVSRWERKTDRIRAFTAADGLPVPSPTAFAEDGQGQLWIGFYTGGLARYREGRFEFFGKAEGIPPGQIRALFLDRRGSLWAATNGSGARRIDDPGGGVPVFDRLTTTDGLSSRNVLAITEDSSGRLYFGTDRGLDRYDPSTGRVWHYGAVDGLPNGFVNVARRDREGALWFGTLQGLARLKPGLERPSPPPPVYIDRIRIAGRDHPVSELGQSEVAGVRLDHRQNRIHIEYGALGYRAGSIPRYQYRLIGADSAWSELRAARSVEYANLAPGSYRFEVRAVDAEGRPSPRPASFAFRILPPLWKRGWFLAATLLLVFASVFVGYAGRVRVLRRRHRELARMVAERTAELSAAKSQLEEYNRTLEERIAAGINALREAERMAAYGRLVAGVAHEVRHPIFSLQAAAYVLADRLRGNAELERQLRVLERETARMSALMDDLLAFARPSELHLEPVQLERLIAEAVESDRQTHPEPAPRIVAEVTDDLPPVMLDRGRMIQVLINLIGNARKHAEGVTTIRLRARVEQEGEVARAILEVANDGAPIPEEILPKIFDPFFTSGHGTGLGLAIVRRIVSAHGGEITVRSAEGEGTLFAITLPLA